MHTPSHHPRRRVAAWPLAVVLALFAPLAQTASALEPDQIALVVNANVPASRELASFYAQKRGIPAGRIIALDLLFPDEEMPFERYDASVVPAVRSFLRDNRLNEKVTCLVTFWGVPLRIARRANLPGEQEQLQVIQAELDGARRDLTAVTEQAEVLAKELQPDFTPGQGTEHAQLAKRAGDALTSVVNTAVLMPPGQPRDRVGGRLMTLFDKLMGDAETSLRMATSELARLAPPDAVSPQRVARAKQQAAEWAAQFNSLKTKPPSPESFAATRTLVRDHYGLFRYYELLAQQLATYDSKETESAFDSELAMVWWDNYPRHRWQANPLNFKMPAAAPGTPPTLMVMRLDGPTEQSVDRIILTSMKVEKVGLKGQVALDARGLKGENGYGRYDGTIRRLADLLKSKTTLQVTFEDTEALFQPAPNAPKGVAIYCGWYSLRNYVPALTFSEGAVGFHVASGELVSLRTPNERGWVRGLINDGVVGTLGPVAEPYLHAFPAADEFFPLLTTGDLTLAEVYWKTTPLTSWMITCIGDPLYRPYKVNPPLKATDLPEALRIALPKPPAPAPSK